MTEGNVNNALVVMVPHDSDLKNAILSEKAIRKSGTNVKIVALVSSSVSMETRSKLNEIYDMVVVKETFKDDLPCASFLLDLNLENCIVNYEGMRGSFDGEETVMMEPPSVSMETRYKLNGIYETAAVKEKLEADDLLCSSFRHNGHAQSLDFGNYEFNQKATNKLYDDKKTVNENPNANSIDEYWDLLVNGKNTCSAPPKSRDLLVDMDHNIKGNFVKCPIDQFDASFFGFSPTEASFTDPQARLLLEVSWEALEDAAINPETLCGENVGVFHGSWLQEYKEAMNNNCSPPSQDFLRKYLGNAFGSTAAKISFFYELTGPNIATESGCSSSMVAIDLACKSLHRNECKMALACGANLILHANKHFVFCAEDGKTKAFDAGANGYARAEGIAVLVLKRFSDALLNNDNIHGIIRGIGISQEGLSKSFGTPTVQSEVDAMKEALVAAKVTPTEVDYVEAHATGTAVGDPIEAAAIVKAYHSGSTKRESPLLIGSGKTNVGHTESCSGMAGIIKVLFSMKHELIPKHINLTTLNPQIDFTTIPGRIPLETSPWPRKSNERPRIAGVSSFGITGTDVHVILQEPPTKEECQNENTPSIPQILTLSAKSDIALEQMTNEFLTYLQTPINHSIQDITYTAHACRTHHPFRRAIVGSTIPEMVRNIRKRCNTYSSPKPNSISKKICFTFPGRIGTMPLEPIRQLYQTIPYFKQVMDSCDQIFKQIFPASGSFIEILLQNTKESSSTPKGVKWYAFFISCHFSIAKLWSKWGIFPSLVMGHCFGEFSAAVVCGALDLKDAFKMLKIIPILLESQIIEPTAMIAISSNQKSVENLVHNFFLNHKAEFSSDWIDIAAINSNFQSIVIGPSKCISAFQQYCTEQDIKIKNVPCDFCAHSRGVEKAYPKTLEILNKITHQPIKIPFISSSTGELVKDSELNGIFWYKVVRNCVHFKKACRSAINTQLAGTFLEIGLDTSLTNFTKANLEDHQSCFNFLASFPKSDYNIYNTLSEIYTLGTNINWENFHSSGRRNKVSLPHYPFQRKSFWYERKTQAPSHCSAPSYLNWSSSKIVHSFLGEKCNIPPVLTNLAIFRNDKFIFPNKQIDFIQDHLVGYKVIFPGAGFVEMMLSSWKLATKLENMSNYSLEKFTIHEPLFLDKSSTVSIVSVVNKDTRNICIYTTTETGLQWRLHAMAYVNLDEQPQLHETFLMNNILNMNTVEHNDDSEERANAFYLSASKVGLNYGPAFKSLKRIYTTEKGDLVAEIKDFSQTADFFSCHPILIDAMIQGFMLHTKPAMTKLYVPIKINKFVLLSPLSLSETGKLFVHCQKGNTTSVSLLDQNGRVVALMRSPELVATTIENIVAAADNKSKGLIFNSHVPNSISIYDVIWKQAKFYQQSRHTFGDMSGWMNSEYQNELSDIQRTQNTFSAFSEQDQALDEAMDKICYLYVVKALFNIGWVQEMGLNIFKEENSTFNITEKWGILPGLVKAFRHFLSYVDGSEENLKEATLERVEIEIESILKLPQVKAYDPVMTIHKCGWNLAGILQGKYSSHKILFGEDNLAEQYYLTSRFAKSHESLEKLFTFFASKKAAALNGQNTLKILEVGAGTGVFLKTVIPVLKKMGVKFHYHFTDISRTLVSKAKEMFEMDSQNVTFKLLNIEVDPLKQGFPPKYFDIVFALNVLHATRNLGETLKNIQMVTKLGGVLLLGETEKPLREVDIISGGLEGYWLFEDKIRKNHCTLNSDMWLRIMAENGFSGNPCQILSCGGQMSAISASKTNEKLDARKLAEWIVFEFGNVAFSEYKYLMESVTNRTFNVFSLDPKMRGEELQEYINVCLKGDLEGVLIWICSIQSLICDPIAREILEPMLYISKYLQKVKLKTLPKFHLVTANCWDLPSPINLTEINLEGPTLAQAWGFMRNARIELTGISSKSIDLEMSSEIHAKVTQLATELWLDDRETEVVYRKGTRYVRRLMEQTTRPESTYIPNAEMFQAELPKSKALCDIKFTETCNDEQLEQQQVRIEVRSVGLNFRDIFAITKPGSDFANLTSIGLDFSGVVTEVGKSDSRWQVGDAVFGFTSDQGCMRSHLITKENMLSAMPAFMSFTEASTLPTVFLTAWHCMVNFAKLEKGQTMLLHAASGGIGLAAIQIAKILGVNVIGTAGSEKKRRFLRRLGIEHVFNSRTLDFKNEVTKVTGGQGVDMVLNCLTGPGFKESSLAVCRDGGHFVEISKLDIWSEAEVRDVRPKVNYTIVDLTQLDNSVIETMMETLSKLLGEGRIRPLHHTSYPASRLSHALSHFQKAKHIGKVVINMPINHAGNRKTCIFNDRSTYLITGGKTGIGFEVCKWMVMEHGAKYVVLASRSQANENVRQAVVELERGFGAVIICKEVDVSDYTQSKTLIEQDLKDLPPLRGVHHCAAILSDQLLCKDEWPNFARVLSAKAGGAWNLHRLTMETPLEHFVLYSSAVSVFGNVGQTNYSCANSYLDNLAAIRRSMGLPTLSVNWGQWKAGVVENVEVTIFKPIFIKEGIQALNYFMENNQEQNQIVAGTFNFSSILKVSPYLRNTLLEETVIISRDTSPVKVDPVCVATRLKQCVDESAKENVIKSFVMEMLCETLGTAKEDIRNDVSFTDMGMDSLMSIEFTNKMNSAFGENTSGEHDDAREDLTIQVDLEENGTLDKLVSFLLKAWEQV